MPIIGAYVMPHGALSLNPSKYPELKELQLLHKSCHEVAEEIYFLKPDLIILTTPHGICLNRSYGVYINSQAEGSAEWEGDWKDYTVKVELAEDESNAILRNLQKSNIPSEGIVSYSESMPFPLRWGEAIPLWFISQPYKNYTLNPLPMPKCVIVSMPRKRLSEPEKMVMECLDIGSVIYEYCSQLDKKVIIVTSADLAHTHLVTSKTLDVEDVGEDESDIFDKAIELWATNPIENESILIEASKIVTKYLSCGYIGLVLLHGILKKISKNNLHFCDNKSIISKVLCNLHPTYYGMMVAEFKFN